MLNSILEQIWVCKLHRNRFKESKNLSLSKQTQLHKSEYAISAPIWIEIGDFGDKWCVDLFKIGQ
ncbi:hypothetical protein DCD76_13465 [Acinetobacter baumannii]|nr:hypothetical protein EGX84_18790 [Acinetobacter baumannii]MUR90360.1 hypothetical protein [Acinetobacter baumannii]OTL51358.1 hypothetical protein B9Y01_07380 [Acinetobacter baumannii]OTT31880.1 hypothetical protein CAS80_16560 [Acinetobacter baumannii]OTU32387.1 hypothetical protein CAT61_05000 [Acinetobacter baumannii]